MQKCYIFYLIHVNVQPNVLRISPDIAACFQRALLKQIFWKCYKVQPLIMLSHDQNLELYHFPPQASATSATDPLSQTSRGVHWSIRCYGPRGATIKTRAEFKASVRFLWHHNAPRFSSRREKSWMWFHWNALSLCWVIIFHHTRGAFNLTAQMRTSQALLDVWEMALLRTATHASLRYSGLQPKIQIYNIILYRLGSLYLQLFSTLPFHDLEVLWVYMYI